MFKRKLFIVLMLTIIFMVNYMNAEESIKIKIEVDTWKKVGKIKIYATDFKEVFIRRNGRHSTYTEFILNIKKHSEIKKFTVQYGSEVEAFGYKITVGYSVVGTRDFKSQTTLTIIKIT